MVVAVAWKLFKNQSQLLLNTDGTNLSNVIQLPFHTFTSWYSTHTNHVKNPCQYYTGNLVTSPTSPKELSANIPIGSGIKPLNIQPFSQTKPSTLAATSTFKLETTLPPFHPQSHVFHQPSPPNLQIPLNSSFATLRFVPGFTPK